MKARILNLVVTCLFLFIFTLQGFAQSNSTVSQNRTMTIPDKSIQIEELGIIIAKAGDSIFTMVLKEEVDTVSEDNKVQSRFGVSKINGIKISDFEVIESIYKNTEKGKTIEFEFARKDGTYLKKEIIKGSMKEFKVSTSSQNIGMLVGIFIETNDSDKEINIVNVSTKLMPEAFVKHKISKGDKILKINGVSVHTSREAFDEINKVGILQTFTMTFLKGGKEKLIKAVMPEPPQGNEVEY